MKNIYQILIDEHDALVQTNPTVVSLGEYIDSEISALREIKRSIFGKNSKLAQMSLDYNKMVKETNEQISALRKTCKHRIKTYHGDPSGNNDSWNECDHCGACV